MAENKALDEYVTWPQGFIEDGGLDKYEIDYKLRIAENFAKARAAVLTGANDWRELVKWAYDQNRTKSIVRYSDTHPLRMWMDDKPDEALEALQALWVEGNIPVPERIRVFNSLIPDPPTYPVKGVGTRLRLFSALTMALSPKEYPPYRATHFKAAYERTGYPMPAEKPDEATLYEHALGFLNKLVERANALGFDRPNNRLEAQSIVWSYQWPEKRFGPRPGSPNPPVEEDTPTMPPLQDLAEELMFPVKFLQRIENLLEDKRQVIFQGPPGTGKTYTAKKLAACLAGSQERVRLVQFHPSYAYEDFVQGFRPKLIGGQPGFELRDGPLLDMARMARKEPGAKHFLVIDEINRGNLAKVFGELYFLLEYRDEEMRLQYSESGETFAMPKNLYIIGTMNTADRSIALVDLALRRRFYFVEFHPDKWPVKGLLRRWLVDKNPDMDWAADIVDRANKLLADREAAIGPSYFMRGDEDMDEEEAKQIWDYNVLPYVKEHLYGQSEEQLKKFDFDSLLGIVVESGEPGENADESDTEQHDA